MSVHEPNAMSINLVLNQVLMQLIEKQKENPNRERAIAITNLETSILWLKAIESGKFSRS